MLDMKQRQSIIGSDDGLSPGRHQAACRLVGTKPLSVPVLEILSVVQSGRNIGPI